MYGGTNFSVGKCSLQGRFEVLIDLKVARLGGTYNWQVYYISYWWVVTGLCDGVP